MSGPWPTTGSIPSRTLTLQAFYRDAIPSAEELASQGVAEVLIRQPFSFAVGGPTAASFIAFLRSSICSGLRVTWAIVDPPSDDVLASLVHLPPPSGDTQPGARWRAEHAYGQLYWRQGPSFVVIKDVRPSFQHVRIILDREEYLNIHMICQRVTPRREIGVPADVIERFLSEKLIVSFDGWLIGLAYRMRRWPIPFTAV